MTTSTFDTLAAARALEAAKFSREQAEAIAQVIRHGQGELATKDDLAVFATKDDLAALEVRMVKWAVGLALGVAGFTAAVVLAGVRLMLSGAT